MSRLMGLTAALAAVGVLASGVGIALAQDVTVNYVPGKDFSGYKTYTWVEIQGAEKPDQIIDTQIKQAIDKALAAGGLVKVTGAKASLYVAYQIAYTKEQTWNTYNVGGPYAWRGGGMGTATSSTINIGTLVVDLYDGATNKPVWRGDATKTLDRGKDPVKNQEKLQKAVAKLMKNYPPPVKK